MSVGRHGRIGRGGAVQVEAEVVGEDAALENVVEESAVARSEEDGVMGDVLVAAVGGKEEDEEAHAVFAAGEFLVGPDAAVFGGDELAVDGRRIGIGHDDFGFERFAVGEADAGGAPFADEDFLDRGAGPELHAVTASEIEQCIDQRTGAAAGKPDAPFAFEIVNERVET